MKNIHQAINTTTDIDKTDLSGQQAKILSEIQELTNGRFEYNKFDSKKLLWTSDYYGTGKIGAFHYRGIFDGKQAVIKIQGAKPNISEVEMLNKFRDQNKSEIIRPPVVLESFPWSQERGYEIIIFEYVAGEKIVKSGELASKDDVAAFFSVYREYKKNAINIPWLDKPEVDFAKKFRQMVAFSQKIKPESSLRHQGDVQLAEKAVKILEKVWQGVSLEFQHGHFSVEDLVKVVGSDDGDEDDKNEVVLFSNLFWKWKYPFYDVVFSYHWFMYSLFSVEGITPRDIEEQRTIWLDEIQKVADERNDIPSSIINAALLERAVAGLLVDGVVYADEENEISVYLMEGTRREVVKLIEVLI